MNARRMLELSVATLVLMASVAVGAAEFWTGPRITFTKANSANPLLAANQDRITDEVWLTRGASGGIFNARVESVYDVETFTSPVGTEWVFNRTLADGVAGVQFRPWAAAAAMNPPLTVGVDAVMHLIEEDIYIDVRFTSWLAQCCGGFSYVRSTPPTPVASADPRQVPALPWPFAALLGAALFALARHRNR